MFEKIFSIFMLDVPFEEKIRMYYDEHINIFIKNPNLPIFILNEVAHNPDLLKKFSYEDFYSRMRNNVFQMHSSEFKKIGIEGKDMPQLMISVVSLAIFPFIARDMVQMFVPQFKENKAFIAFMQERKTFAADFVLSAMKNFKK